MKTTFLGIAAAAALAAASLAAPTAAQAAAVTITGWAFGGAGSVASRTGGASSLASYSGAAGGFAGALAGTGRFDTSAFVTYCIELEEDFSFGTAPVGYSLVDGASYFAARRLANPLRPEGAQVVDRLGRLFTWAQGQATRVDSVAESTALQLAVWNVVYDNDWSLSDPRGRFSDRSAQATLANSMLAAAAATESRLQVFALTREGRQDFLVVTPVSAPGTLGLAALGVAAAAVMRRRRG